MSLPESNLPEPHLSVKEYARIAGVSEKTAWRYLRDGKLPKYQPGGPNCRVGIPLSALAVTAGPPTDASPTASGVPPTQPTPEAQASTPPAKRPLPAPKWKRQGGRR